MVCAWAWRLVETRAYTPMRIRHLLWHRPHRPVAVGPRHRPAHQQLVGLVPTAVAVAVGADLAADSPGRRHPVLLALRRVILAAQYLSASLVEPTTAEILAVQRAWAAAAA